MQTFYRCSTVGEFSEIEACCSEMTGVSPDPTLTVLKQEDRECGPRNIFLHLSAIERSMTCLLYYGSNLKVAVLCRILLRKLVVHLNGED